MIKLEKSTFWEELNELEHLDGTNEKIVHIIQLIKGYPEAEKYFRLACGDKVFGLAEKSFYNAFDSINNQIEYNHVSNWLYYENSHNPELLINSWGLLETFATEMENSSGGAQLLKIKEIFGILPSLEAKWFSRALLHELRCGVQRKTVNSALKELDKPIIKKFSLMLADKIKTGILDKEAVKKKIYYPAVREKKYDGIRIQAEIFQVLGNDMCVLTSRRGKIKTDDYPEIVKELLRIFSGETVTLDGEVISSSFQELTRKDSVVTKNYVVFDLLNDETLEYQYRWSNLRMLMESKSNTIYLPEHDEINNYEDLLEDFDKAVERGDEGIMVKFLDRPYERGSRKHMFKFKKVFTADLQIVGFNYGEGKRSGKVGSLCLQTREGSIKVDVGSGINDETCEDLSAQLHLKSDVIKSPILYDEETEEFINENNELRITEENEKILQPDFIGKICEIAYNEVTETGSIRFPRFKCIREDKSEADRIEDLQSR